jgi:hypothetical protein
LKRLSASLYEPIRPAGTHAYLVSFQGAQKLLQLCPKATYHVDLDAWRHSSLVLRMFDPMLVYQTFEDTTLTDLSPSTAYSTSPATASPSPASSWATHDGSASSPGTTTSVVPGSASSVVRSKLIQPSWQRVQAWNRWTADPTTKQPWSHVLAEPLLQLTPLGPVLTVQRYVLIVSTCVLSSGLLQIWGKPQVARMVLQGMMSFAVTIRALIWLLMNWK